MSFFHGQTHWSFSIILLAQHLDLHIIYLKDNRVMHIFFGGTLKMVVHGAWSTTAAYLDYKWR
jgi:hypothetical protein